MNKSAVLCLFTVTLMLSSAVEAQTPLNQRPSREVGQNSLDSVDRSTAPNVVEGRELFQPWSVAIDSSSSPAGLYVSDQTNQRILGWRDAANFKNGQKADIVIGQVDFTSTISGGPGTARSAGLNAPNAIAVDGQGNLYVADIGNNRILRFPKPFAQTGPVQVPNMVIGQSGLTTNTANSGGVSASSISFTFSGTGQSSGLAFDSAGNLWVSDSGNNRVLRFSAADLAKGDNKPSADLVIGQQTFTTNTAPGNDATARLNKAVLRLPSGIAFDPQGRLYVSDSLSRVLVFRPPFTTGMSASRILGVAEVNIVNGTATSPDISAYSLLAPEGIFMIGDKLAVVDRGHNRILIYDTFETWPAETPIPAPAGTTFIAVSPAAKWVIGQTSFTTGAGNRDLTEANETSLLLPTSGITFNNEVYVVDSLNNRVLVFPAASTLGTGTAAATRVLGQDNFYSNALNLLEGKEMWLFNGFGQSGNVGPGTSDGAGLVIDNTSNPPRLYVSDTFNNRVLGFKDARNVRPGDRADIVIGQVDFQRSVANWPSGKPDKPSDVGLFHPSGLAVDASGDLWVADSGNARVLRFAKPFDQQASAGQKANLVLGQANFGARFTDPYPFTMAFPYGLAFTVNGDLLVSDSAHNRVLYFDKPADGFKTGQSAAKVIGQPDLYTVQPTSFSSNRFANPRGIATDTDDRLYVVDAGLSRMTIYDRIGSAGNDPSPAITIGSLSSPQSVYVSRYTGEIWVANTRGNSALRFPRFDRLALSQASDYSVSATAPLAVTQDAFGNLFVAEASNRVAIYFNQLTAANGASFNETRPLSPGMIATLFPPANSTLVFTDNQTAAASGAPLPFVLADTSVTVNGKPAPLYYVGTGQINFVMPYSTPTSGTAEVQVTHPSTGQIVANFNFPLAVASPGLFVMNTTPPFQVAAVNEDGTVNSPSNPIGWGKVISIYATGGGALVNPPEDGNPATGPVSTQIRPDVLLGTEFLDPKYIQYSGMAPQFPGLWQINIQIPSALVQPGPADLVVRVNSILSNAGKGGAKVQTVIYVKQ